MPGFTDEIWGQMRGKMKHFFVVSGGNIDDGFACDVIEKQQKADCAEISCGEQKRAVFIAADAGMEFFYRNGIKPDIIVGDFDSVGSEALSYFRSQPDIRIQELNPVKDDTDTEYALRLAISMGAEQITILGGTGSRLDHVLGNIELLGIGLEKGISIELLDANNRIRMIDKGVTLRRREQFGTYVSLLPYTSEVEHLTLRGFKYPLTDYCLKGFCSLGVSNEISEEEALITFDGGILLVIESRDGDRE